MSEQMKGGAGRLRRLRRKTRRLRRWRMAGALTPCFRRMASFSRLIQFDKRGTGFSDPTAELATFEQRMGDV
ncbi:MAG: hypothetical protein DLM70_08460 [Chloroflexi bacterium]|nr:MAG: hypothetical protein DLM70_08460 [Chloroflexota bacterium]